MKALLVVAQTGFQPKEYNNTRKEIEEAGITVKVASFEKGEAFDNNENKITVDYAIKDIKTNEWDAIVLIGGPGAAKQFIGNPEIHRVVMDANNDEKKVAAICISPLAVAETGLLKERKATMWNGDGKQAEKIASHGAIYDAGPVVMDTRFITANGPEAATEFGKKIVSALKEGVEHTA